MPNPYLSRALLSSYLITSGRALLRQQRHMLFNLLGLSIGIAAAILIVLWVRFELSFDNYHPNAAHTYRLGVAMSDLDQEIWPSSNHPLRTVASELIGANQITNIRYASNQFSYQGRRYQLPGFLLAADENITERFSIEVLYGDLHQTLSSLNQLAISASQAEHIFGHRDVIGESLEWSGESLTVSAVFADLPANTHLSFTTLIGSTLR